MAAPPRAIDRPTSTTGSVEPVAVPSGLPPPPRARVSRRRRWVLIGVVLVVDAVAWWLVDALVPPTHEGLSGAIDSAIMGMLVVGPPLVVGSTILVVAAIGALFRRWRVRAAVAEGGTAGPWAPPAGSPHGGGQDRHPRRWSDVIVPVALGLVVVGLQAVLASNGLELASMLEVGAVLVVGGGILGLVGALLPSATWPRRILGIVAALLGVAVVGEWALEQRSQQPVSTGVQVAYVARGAGDCALLQQGRVPVDHVVRMDSNATSCRLSGVDLSDASLRRAQLVNADLRGAKLARADLRGARMDGADLTGADLTGADLSEVILSGADLTRADLAGANLSRASTNGANLTGADLTGATIPWPGLAHATWGDTTCPDGTTSGAAGHACPGDGSGRAR